NIERLFDELANLIKESNHLAKNTLSKVRQRPLIRTLEVFQLLLQIALYLFSGRFNLLKQLLMLFLGKNLGLSKPLRYVSRIFKSRLDIFDMSGHKLLLFWGKLFEM